MPAVLAFIMGACVMGLTAAVWTDRLHDQLEQERARGRITGTASSVDAFSRHYPSPVPPPNASDATCRTSSGMASELEG